MLKVSSGGYRHAYTPQQARGSDATTAFGHGDAERERVHTRFYRIDPVESTSAQRALDHYRSVQAVVHEHAPVEVLNRIDISV